MLAFDLQLDGVSILDRFETCRIVYDRSAMHNQITVNTADRTLWSAIDPDDAPGTARLMVILGADTLHFLLETRSGTEGSFSFGGRSLSAVEEKEYAGEVSSELASSAGAAQDVAAAMLTSRALTWEIGAFTLPAGYSFYGSPARGLQHVADVFGAVVRSDDAGNFVVTDRFRQMFPPWGEAVYPSGTPDFELDTLNAVLDGPSYAEVAGENYDAVEVAAQDLRGDGLEIEVVTENPTVGVDCAEIRVFWPEHLWTAGLRPYKSLAGPRNGLAVDGMVSGGLAAYGQYTETLTFQNGEAQTRHIIDHVDNVTAISEQDLNSSLGWFENRGERTIRLTHNVTGAPMSGIYEVTYTTHYIKYFLSTNIAGKFLVGFAAPEMDAPKKFQLGTGENPAPRIEDPYLTDPAGKQFRAVSVLKASSTMKKVSVELPMATRIRDGMVCSFSDPVFGLSGNFWVDRVEMNIEGVRMTYRLDLLQCHRA